MRVPPFKTYFATLDVMDVEQRRFYDFWLQNMKDGRFVDVDGQVSYLYAHIAPVLASRDYGRIRAVLEEMVSGYPHEESFCELCQMWIADTYFAQGDVAMALASLPPPRIGSRATMLADNTLSMKRLVGRRISGRDVVAIAGPKVTAFGRKNLALIEEQISAELRAREAAEDIDLLVAWSTDAEATPYSVFTGSDAQHFLDTNIWLFSLSRDVLDTCVALIRDAENVVRVEAHLPRVGEGWVAETELFYALKARFSQETVLHHARFEWLGRQHLDIFFPERNVALEYQGPQHDEPVAFFGGQKAFEQTRARDRRKRMRCREAGVRLIYVRSGYNLDEVVAAVLGETS